MASGGASPLLMAGHRQVINRISKSSQDNLIYNFIIATFDCQGNSQGEGISAREGICLGTPWWGAAAVNCAENS